ncbi:MAG: guanosine-3',5'-bis(diphosphate) 3'-pyrophosphohydrolase [Parcubacteria bacterium C7867-008]|nr:MAG: guanosine-3',5'-bis(diphosphate) 3'-pyrophosphohydrolase [Parcubacteria bacterium C7867-008]
MTTVKEILAAMRDVSPEEETLIRKAYAFSEEAHKDHKRYSGEQYFLHPAAVAKHLAELGMDADTIAAGLLHDTVEDAGITEEQVQQEFGSDVRFLVEGVTKLGKHKYRGAERHAESLRRLLVATSADVRVLIIKLADRYHNMTTLEHVPEEKRRRIALETLEIYAPLADRLGMGLVKRDLEDLSFPYVDADAYAHVMEVRKLKTKETEQGLIRVQKELQHALARRALKNFRTDIRMKGLWSLHQKLVRKNDDISAIHDIAALRVIVPTVDDCYTVLGVIHSLWRPLPGEFKDYISFTKPNGYQSLHTTIITGDAGIVEVQVRTEEMHQNAQYGIASHMSYKQLGEKGKTMEKQAQRVAFERLSFSWMRGLVPSLLNLSRGKGTLPVVPTSVTKAKAKKVQESPRWLSELADAHAPTAGSEDFVQGLREDFFSHRVFVFTPKGDVIDLPINSTAIDFAYAIHSELGNHMYGAKVNSKMVSFDTVLRNGDVVEILEKASAHPTTKWLDYARTSMARRHIRVSLEIPERGTTSVKGDLKPNKTHKKRSSKH